MDYRGMNIIYEERWKPYKQKNAMYEGGRM